MTTSYKQPGTSVDSKRVSPAWQYAAIALAALCLVLGYLVMQRPAATGHMTNTMSGEHYDHGFINMMIPHHEQAIEEARVAQREARHPELKQMADNIIRAQQAEIEQMKQWRKDWYGE
jgi:uncharacterized protein (DUF305 family)